MKTTLTTSEGVVNIPLVKKQDNAVVGLIWQPLQSVRALQAEAKNLIKNEKCEHFVIHAKGNRAQCGIIAKLAEKKRHYSAALMLMKKLGDSWLGVFKLPNGNYWLVGADNGQIVPGCDVVFTEQQQVMDRYKDYELLFSWQAIYASSDLAIEGKTLDVISTLKAVPTNNDLRINYVFELNKKTQRIAKKVIAVAVVVGVALAGWNYYQNKQEEERQARLAALLAERQRQEGFSESEWRKHLPARDLLASCFREMGGFQINLGGWNVTAISCENKLVKAVYKPGTNATTNNFIGEVQALYPNKYSFQKGNLGIIQLPMTLSGDRKQEQLQPIASVVGNVLEKLQTGQATGKIDDVLASKQKTAKFELTTAIAPVTLLQDVNLDGIVINNIIATLSEQGSLTWKISGVIYGK